MDSFNPALQAKLTEEGEPVSSLSRRLVSIYNRDKKRVFATNIPNSNDLATEGQDQMGIPNPTTSEGESPTLANISEPGVEAEARTTTLLERILSSPMEIMATSMANLDITATNVPFTLNEVKEGTGDQAELFDDGSDDMGHIIPHIIIWLLMFAFVIWSIT